MRMLRYALFLFMLARAQASGAGDSGGSAAALHRQIYRRWQNLQHSRERVLFALLSLSLLYSSLHIVALYLIVYLQPLFPPNQKEGDAARAPSDAASCAVLLQRRPHSGRRPRPELLLLLCIQRARAEGTNTIRDSRPLWSYVCLIGLTL